MSRMGQGDAPLATAPKAESKLRPRWLALIGALVAMGGLPAVADAHGAVDPIATSYLAVVSRVPAGLEAKVIDGGAFR